MTSPAFSVVTLAAAQSQQAKDPSGLSQVEYELLASLLDPHSPVRRRCRATSRPHLAHVDMSMELVEGFDPRD